MDNLIDTHLTASHLRLLVAIVEERSLVAAAKRLNMTQPAVTKSLQAAEHQLGIRLFDRTASGMVPTVYGRALVARARVVLSQLRSAVQEINDLRAGTAGRIVVGTLLTASASLLPAAIAQLGKRGRNNVVTVVEGTNDVLIPGLRRGDVDIVVGRLPAFTNSNDLNQEILLFDAACIVVRREHPLVRSPDLHLPDLLKWDWILPPLETRLRSDIEKSFRDEDLTPPIPAVESVCFPVNQALLLTTNCVSVWPGQLASHSLEFGGEIAILPIELPATRCPIGITSRKDSQLSPAVQIFLDILRQIARSAPQSSSHNPDGHSPLPLLPQGQ
ncbi:MAG: LysR family transcriptional regulator [Steroidobacteraceae bacterium]